MNKNYLSPYDCDMCAMIEDLTKQKVSIEATPEIIKISWLQLRTEPGGNDEQRNIAIKQAVEGRLGKRLCGWDYVSEIISVRFEYDGKEYPEEIRTRLVKFDPKAGTRYCRTLKEINAIQVRRDNLDELLKFTGGGTMTTPRTPDGIAVYSFPNQNGLYVDVTETWYIIREDNGEFTTRSKRDFDTEFEPKGAHIVGNYEQAVNPVIKEALELLDIAEKNKKKNELIPLSVRQELDDLLRETQKNPAKLAIFNQLFGTDIDSRTRKLTEEYGEFMEAANAFIRNPDDMGYFNAMLDELADLNAVVFHIAGIVGATQYELLEMAFDKVQGRQIDPNYKRTKGGAQ